ncbi:MAG: hypothetical protein WD851_15130 [Pirellulales bacterium]
MTTVLLARFRCRAAFSVCATALLVTPLLGEDTDVFELLTGQPAPIQVETPLPEIPQPVTNSIHSEPLATDVYPLYTLVAEVEEVEQGTEEPLTPATEMSLNRPLDALTVSPAPPRQLQESMQSFPEQYQIRNLAQQQFGSWTTPRYDVSMLSSGYGPSCFAWAAPAVYHRPLYFEQPNVERYGHYVSVCKGGNCLQSAVCAAHFFGTVPLLPYKIGADPCCERHYVLGAYRPGSCNPHQLVRPEVSCRGLALQGVAVTGLVFLIP